MKALLIISHGSRRAASNEEVASLTEQIRLQADEAIPLVKCAFLEITDPRVQTAIDDLVEQGASDILIFPHFLAAGTHVTNDIPRELALAREHHPGVQFTCLPHLGALKELPALISDLAKNNNP